MSAARQAKPTSQEPGKFLLFGLNQKVNKTLVRLLTESSRLLWRCSFPLVFIGILRVILEQVLDFPWILPKKLHGNSTSKNAINLKKNVVEIVNPKVIQKSTSPLLIGVISFTKKTFMTILRFNDYLLKIVQNSFLLQTLLGQYKAGPLLK